MYRYQYFPRYAHFHSHTHTYILYIYTYIYRLFTASESTGKIKIDIQYIDNFLERKQSDLIPACLFQHHSLSVRHFLQYLNTLSTWPFHFWKQTSSVWRRNSLIEYKSKSPAAALALFIITAVCSLSAHWDATSGASRLGSPRLHLRSAFPAEQHTQLKETCKLMDLWLVKKKLEMVYYFRLFEQNRQVT